MGPSTFGLQVGRSIDNSYLCDRRNGGTGKIGVSYECRHDRAARRHESAD